MPRGTRRKSVSLASGNGRLEAMLPDAPCFVKTILLYVESWLEFIGREMNLKTLLIISAVANMHSPTTQAASLQLLDRSQLSTMGQSEIPVMLPKHDMTNEQQAQMLQAMKTGLRWGAGEITFDDVQWILGKYQDGPYESASELSYIYYPGNRMSIEFAFDKTRQTDRKPTVKYFQLQVSDHLRPHLAKENYETYLGLHRLVYGELIDGVRKEQGRFFNPGMGDFLGDRNHVGLSYRLPLPADSPFDVYADFYFEGRNDPPDYASLKTADNLRSVTITRIYLTPEELDQHHTAKSQNPK
ncbi:hypothetical protein GXB81_21320 [Paraburkholderia sp. Ac-20336]|uniref:hypothetical protein n=1 Tax=Paraburkholderia sp. Ac-20336 TaxID=2703886 RepID=UPI00197E37A4|nr:hypothetical protein [Paraburkholderia sp. Ac-20336]MBN3805572.1 hypothetical protein [Paraburkholderia sp. Ac-20336]